MKTLPLTFVTNLQYPSNAFDSDHIINMINNHRLFVQLGRNGYTQIELDLITHRVIKVENQNSNIYVTIESLESKLTPIADYLIDNNVVVLKPIGVGTVINKIVQDDYKLNGFYLDI